MQCGRTGSLLVLLSLLAGVLFVASSASSFAIDNIRDLKGLNATSPDAENWCIGANGIVLCGSLRVAGAIDYLAWNGMQFINAADHGRELQYAISNQYGECYNPTEAGSMNDGAGPTTSSVLLGANTNGNIYRTVSKPAFWIAPGQRDPNGGCIGVNPTVVSRFITSKQVNIGAYGQWNAIQYLLSSYVPELMT